MAGRLCGKGPTEFAGGPTTGRRREEHEAAFRLWVVLLSAILISAAIIVNFNIGDRLFKSRLAEWLAHNDAGVADGGSAPR